jgi:hypothetical protein
MVLDEILELAKADQQAGRIGPGMVAQLTGLTGQCGLNSAPTTLTTAQHCQKVNAARAAAAQHNWPLCVEHMQHGH